MNPVPAVGAAAFVSVLGLALLRRQKKETDETKITEAPLPSVARTGEEPAPGAKKHAVDEKLPVLKAFVLNKKVQLVGELAVETESIGIGYEEVLRLLEGKGLVRQTRLDSNPYTAHIVEEDGYFIVAFTRSEDDETVRRVARSLLRETIWDLT